MKFNFEKLGEKIKRKGKKVLIGSGIILASISTAQEHKKEVKDNNLNKNKTEIFNNKIKKETKNISFNEVLLTQINNLEGKFSSLSKLKEENKIIDGSISIISSQELEQKINITKNTFNKEGIEITSPLENRYITDVLNFNIINNIDNIKVLDKSSLAWNGIKDINKMSDEGYINLKKNGYKHYIPEYYFVLNQEDNDSNIIFKLKIISSKNRSIVKEISIKETLPPGDRFQNPIFIKLVEDKIVPDIANEIKNFLKNNKQG